MVFVDIIDTQDLSLLVIEGQPTIEELQVAWEALYASYFDALNGDDSDKHVSEATELAVSHNRLARARFLLDSIAKVGPREKLLEQLKTFGYLLPDEPTQLINLFTANYKRDYVELQVLATQSEEDQSNTTILNSAYYLGTIAIIITTLKCSIDLGSLTVGLYVELVKQYKLYCNSIPKINPNE